MRLAPVLSPVRTIGLICNRLPVSVYEYGTQKFILAAAGTSFVVYDADTLRIKFTSRLFESPIVALAVEPKTAEYTFVATADGSIICRHRHQDVWLYHNGNTVYYPDLTQDPTQDTTEDPNLDTTEDPNQDTTEDPNQDQDASEPALGLSVADGWLLAFYRSGHVLRLAAGTGAVAKRFALPELQPLGGVLGCAAAARSLAPVSVQVLNSVSSSLSARYYIGGFGSLVAEVDTATGTVVRRLRSAQRAIASRLEGWNRTLASPSVLDDWQVDVVETTDSPALFVAANSRRPEHRHLLPAVVCLLDEENDQCLGTITLAREQGRVNALAFKRRLDQGNGGGKGHPADGDDDPADGDDPAERVLLYIACANGDIVVIDVDRMQLAHTLKGAHLSDKISAADHKTGQSPADALVDCCSTGVCSLRALSPGGTCGCLFVSSGSDNSLKVWHIEDVAHGASVLKQRAALSGTVAQLAFYDDGDEAKQLLAACNTGGPCNIGHPGCGATGAGTGRVGELSYYQVQQHFVYPTEKALRSINAARKTSLRDLPPILCLAFVPDRHYDWPNVVTVHAGRHEVYLWSAERRCLVPAVMEKVRRAIGGEDGAEKRAAEQTLTNMLTEIAELKADATFGRAPATGVALSQCGHFAVVGYADGTVHHFNLQSRRPVGCFTAHPPDLETVEQLEALAAATIQETDSLKGAKKRRVIKQKIAEQKRRRAHKTEPPHTGPVRFLHTLQSTTLFTASAAPGDLAVKVWDLRTKRLLDQVDLAALLQGAGKHLRKSRWDDLTQVAITKAVFDGNVATIAFTGPDHTSLVLVADLLRKSLFRCYGPLAGRVLDANISPLGNWLALSVTHGTAETAGTEGDLMIYDLVSNNLIEWMRFPCAVTAFTFHPSGAFVLTAHAPSSKTHTSGSGAQDRLTEALFPKGAVYVWANLALFTSELRTNQTGRVKHPRAVELPPVDMTPEDEPEDELEDKLDMAQATDWVRHLPDTPDVDCLKSDPRWGPIQLGRLLNWETIRIEAEKPRVERKDDELPFFLYSEVKASMPVTQTATHDQVKSAEGDLPGWGDGEDTWMTQASSPATAATVGDQTPGPGDETLGHEKTSRESREDAVSLEGLLALRIPQIHLQILNLKSDQDRLQFLKALAHWCQEGVAVDFVQVLVKLFFHYHGEHLFNTLSKQPVEHNAVKTEYVKLVHAIHTVSSAHWNKLGVMLNRLICYIKLISLLQFE
ncbi:WD domain, G-beta repeat protein [Gregarina niphandrodes]|uniref:WD domain, G-beta repeat protein n=1 Tax=Gregarina niphandrodes TaxID=110365 RepID=A0A023B266_GRENI|nr:WD domain, G-beta repeat protein [Gregarina niphandrodes]EZG51531.1 WD domain, G-beta repeat protein [Gregarina niphandrodes]|eukprot:XP_011131969.1 WD domain, G-beta repeat protein [Gregarina niphandrodes]